MNQKPELLYLDLMKKTLSFMLWPEPPRPIISYNYKRSSIRQFLYSFISNILQKKKLQLCKINRCSEAQRKEGCMHPWYADTMIGLKRLDQLQQSIEAVINENIEGDFIETGVWRGGACIFMRAVLAAYGVEDRNIFVADSFKGLPKPNAEEYPADKDDTNYISDYLKVSQEEVENNFRRYGLLDKQTIFLKGWFKDTLPQAPVEKISILRLDGDMYESTMDSLTHLYPKLSKGGFCIIDDYGVSKNCASAVNDYREKHEIHSELKEIDLSSRYWRKDI